MTTHHRTLAQQAAAGGLLSAGLLNDPTSQPRPTWDLKRCLYDTPEGADLSSGGSSKFDESWPSKSEQDGSKSEQDGSKSEQDGSKSEQDGGCGVGDGVSRAAGVLKAAAQLGCMVSRSDSEDSTLARYAHIAFV